MDKIGTSSCPSCVSVDTNVDKLLQRDHKLTQNYAYYIVHVVNETLLFCKAQAFVQNPVTGTFSPASVNFTLISTGPCCQPQKAA